MSLTQDYKLTSDASKNITLTGLQAFAVARALRSRVESLTALHDDALRLGENEASLYLLTHISLAGEALAILNAAPLARAEGMKS